MDQLTTFITEARSKGWDDAKITQTLSDSGWQQSQIEAALAGLYIPVAQPITAQKKHYERDDRPSITALQAALQHVLLWVFTLTSTIMVGIVSAALFSHDDTSSSNVLITYLVLEIVTFTPFLLLYLRYARQLKAQPELMTGRIWSIITIVLHSIGLIIATVGLLLVIILVHNSYTVAGAVGSGTVAIMDGLVVAAYTIANFARNPNGKLRMRYLRIFPGLLFILIAILGIIALTRVAPLRADDQTEQHLVTAVNNTHNYAENKKRLPTSQAEITNLPAGVTYQKLSQSTYEVCAVYRVDHGSLQNGSGQDDSYVDTYDFDSGHKGRNCWQYENDDLMNNNQVLQNSNRFD